MSGQISQVKVVNPGEIDESTHAALIPEAQLHDLSDLALLFGNIIRRNPECPGICGFIQIRSRPRIISAKGVKFP